MISRLAVPPRRWLLALAAVAVGLPVAGCDRVAEPGDAAPPALDSTGPDLLASPAGSLESEVGAVESGPMHGARSRFFPLEQGNRWFYERHARMQLLPDQGEPPPPEQLEATIETQIAGTEQLFGRTYIVASEHWIEPGGSFDQWIRYRQDRAGLYEADVSTTQPPTLGPVDGSPAPSLRLASTAAGRAPGVRVPLDASIALARARLARSAPQSGWLRAFDQLVARRSQLLACAAAPHTSTPPAVQVLGHARPGGVLENEVLRLDYPLRPGATWPLRAAEPELFTLTVERPQVLNLPAGRFAAWRLRMDSSLFGPEDQVHIWYSRCGQLQLVAHLIAEATDEQGNRIGTLVWDERNALADLELPRRACR